VSNLPPQLTEPWTNARRMNSAWRLLGDLPVDRLMTQRCPVREAASAYRLIDQQPQQTVQVLLTYR